MELFLTDDHRVFLPGTDVRGTFCVRQCAVHPDPNHEPTVKASGYTIIWKPNTENEIDERSIFFEDTAVLNPAQTNADYLLPNNDLIGYSKIFEFNLLLPKNLPPSHEVPFGHTRYKLEARYNGQTVIHHFSVNQWIGIPNRTSNIVKREILSASLFDCCHPIEVMLTLNQSHYLPGETVYVVAMIINNSWKDIIFSKISIIQTTKYWKTRYLLPIKHVRIIAEGIRGQINSGHKQIWKKQPFYIPAVIPTTSPSNNPFNFFEVKYKLKIKIKLRDSNKNIALKQKLFIGNWDKSTHNNKDINDMPKNNDLPQEVAFEDCSFCKSEKIDFIPKYLIYKTNK